MALFIVILRSDGLRGGCSVGSSIWNVIDLGRGLDEKELNGFGLNEEIDGVRELPC